MADNAAIDNVEGQNGGQNDENQPPAVVLPAENQPIADLAAQQQPAPPQPVVQPQQPADPDVQGTLILLKSYQIWSHVSRLLHSHLFIQRENLRP